MIESTFCWQQEQNTLRMSIGEYNDIRSGKCRPSTYASHGGTLLCVEGDVFSLLDLGEWFAFFKQIRSTWGWPLPSPRGEK